MTFFFGPNVQKRMKERGITLGMIAEVMENPDEIYPDDEGQIYKKAFSFPGRIMNLVCAIDDTVEPVFIKTVYLEKI